MLSIFSVKIIVKRNAGGTNLDSHLPSQQQVLTSRQAMDMAVQHFHGGRLSDAENICLRILEAAPDQPAALHLLGVMAHQSGELEGAVEFILRALVAKPNDAQAYGSLGNVYQDLGRFDKAVASFREAISRMPNLAEAHNNLGNALRQLGKLDDAAASIRNALAIDPNIAQAHHNLGNVLRDLGRPEAAISSFHQAVALQLEFAEAYSGLGNAYQDLGQGDAAVASFQTALSIRPDFAEAHSNLGFALKELGRIDEAFASHRRAASLEPQNNSFWFGLAQSLETKSFTSVDDGLRQQLLKLLERPAVRPAAVVRSIIGALRHHPEFSRMLKLILPGAAEGEIADGGLVDRLPVNPLLLRLMALSPIDDLEIEQVFTCLRRAILTEAMAGRADAKNLPFAAAMALHCFVNEYVFPESAQESAMVEQLQERIATILKEKQEVTPSLIVALGAYRPLHSFPWARDLGEMVWTGCFSEVVERQILEPREEFSLRPQIDRLTGIAN